MSRESLNNAPKFRSWKRTLEENGCQIHRIEELETIRKGNGEILFSMLRMDAEDASGSKMLPVVVIRGHFVSVLTLFRERETGDEYLLLVRQPRVANGEVFYEHPAGMMDGESDPAAVALKELEEETGLKISAGQLKRLNHEPLYSSPGLLDEGGYFFSCELELSRQEILAYDGKAAGDAGEHEHITTAVVPYGKAPALIKNSNGLTNIYLYEQQKSRLTVN